MCLSLVNSVKHLFNCNELGLPSLGRSSWEPASSESLMVFETTRLKFWTDLRVFKMKDFQNIVLFVSSLIFFYVSAIFSLFSQKSVSRLF